MTFTARIIRGSAIHRLWREMHRTGGAIHGAQFSWVSSNDYVSGALTDAQVAALRGHPAVRLEAIDMPMPTAPVRATPAADPASEPDDAEARPSRLSLPSRAAQSVQQKGAR